MQKITLPQKWTARAVSNFDEVPDAIAGRDIPAQVPGCIHLDLLREALIPDPYLEQNEWTVQWIGRTDWEFFCEFSVDAGALKEERLDLVCEGLDSIATIWVNDVEVGRSRNMHVESRFDIKSALMKKGGEEENARRETGNGKITHRLTIRFHSATHYARAQRDKLGDLPHANSYKDQNGECEPFHFIRKNACNFGWDWGPALITCGVWKAIRLEAWSVARIESVRPLVRMASEKIAVLDVEVALETTDSWDGAAHAIVGTLRSPAGQEHRGDSAVDESARPSLSITVFQPALWNPVGYGEANLYDLHVHITGLQVQWGAKIGLRETRLDTSPDEMGAKWDIVVNNQKIWCKGANWIPDDVFLPRANDADRVRQRLTQAREAGMNTIRVWGGGIYETDEFYAICDELGLLVWQDFLFACAAYSEDDDTLKLVEAEARHNICRLSKHPSLVIWNGCNENIWGFFDWGWPEKLGGRGWGAKYYFDLLPELIQELAPETPYWPGSPFSGSMEIHPLADAWGNKHMWDTWNEVSHENFRRYSPRFASEFGHQAPATFATMARAIPQAERDPFSATLLVHQKAADGNLKLHSRLHEIFEPTDNFDDWLYLTQLVQARAMTTAVEWFRSRSACSGALFWQLNDCWPVVSWAAIDGDGREKPLYYAAKQFFRERLLTIQPDGERLAIWAHNDCEIPWHDTIKWAHRGMADNQPAQSGQEHFWVAPRELKKVCTFPAHAQSARSARKSEFLTAQTDSQSAYWFFGPDKNLLYPEPKWRVELQGNRLTIHAETLLRDFYINADRFGGRPSDNLVTLLPGQSWSVEIEDVPIAALARVDFSQRPIVNCANYFGSGENRT